MKKLKAAISRSLNLGSMRKHRSRLGWRAAPAYSSYLGRCRSEAPVDHFRPDLGEAVEAFRRDGVTSFETVETSRTACIIFDRLAARERAGEPIWTPLNGSGGQAYTGDLWRDCPELEDLFRGPIGEFLRGYFASPFKLFYGSLYRSEALPDGRLGSQLWHSDGGPGICVNVMYYLHTLEAQHGALEALPWSKSMEIFEREPNPALLGSSKRDVLTKFYEAEIEANYKNALVRPLGGPGLVVPFLNNTIHRGGFPAKGKTRTAIVFHCYPSHQPTNFERYRLNGIKKSAPYPADPAAEF